MEEVRAKLGPDHRQDFSGRLEAKQASGQGGGIMARSQGRPGDGDPPGRVCRGKQNRLRPAGGIIYPSF